MEKNIIKSTILTVIISFTLVLMTGCSEPYGGVAAANGHVRRGLYQKALAAYLHAAEKTRFTSVVEYNIGNVYFYLGESERAFESWGRTRGSAFDEIGYRSNFNRGVVLYGLQEYQKSAESFLDALRIFPEREEAKINLEYCVRQLNVDIPERISAEETDSEETINTMMSIIRQSEKMIWKEQPAVTTADTEKRDW